MALNCSGTAVWGSLWGSGWGGYPAYTPGGVAPTYGPFDLFCFCGDAIKDLATFEGVDLTPGDVSHGEPSPLGYLLTSADGTASEVFVDRTLGSAWTLQVTFEVESAPPDFSAGHALFFGGYDDTLAPAGIFFSQVGLAFGSTYDDSAYVLPDSAGLIVNGETYVFKLVVDGPAETVYVYLSTLSASEASGGPLLRYVLPLVRPLALPLHQEGAYVYLAGSGPSPAQINLLTFCMANAALIDNYPPVADAGKDQVVATCSVIQLDGSKSADVEGATITYKWYLTDAPLGSKYVDLGQDGSVVSTPFSNKLHTSHAPAGADPFVQQAEDVLLYRGSPHVISGDGTDGDGAYIEVALEDLPGTYSGQGFKVVRQDGFLVRNAVKPQFLPDVPGFYRFRLVVSDGSLDSSPSDVLVNVIETNAPRGVVPDGSVFWDYMSDVARLLEDQDRFEVLWTGLLQVIGTELLYAWQVDYSKGLKDVPSTVCRKWLHYEPLLREPFPYLSRFTSYWTGLDSAALAASGLSYDGTALVLSLPYRSTLLQITVPSKLSTPALLAAGIQSLLQDIDPRFTAAAVLDGGDTKVRIYAPFPFSIVAGTTAPFSAGSNALLQGSAVDVLGPKSVRLDRSLQGLGLKADDLLCLKLIDGSLSLFRLAVVHDSESDPVRFSRVLLKDELPVGVPLDGAWVFPGVVESPQLDFYKGLVVQGDAVVLELTDTEDDTVHINQQAMGTHPSLPQKVAVYPDALYLAQLAAPSRFTLALWGVYRKAHLPVDDVVQEIPFLQRLIRSTEDEILRANLDFFLSEFRGQRCISFNQDIWTGSPVPRLWAEYSYLDNSKVIEANFGAAAGLKAEDLAAITDNTPYLSAVRGLWFAYVKGPRVANLRMGAQVLLGLPFAEEAGEVIDINPQYSSRLGRIVLRDTTNAKIVRTYTYPRVLGLEKNPATGKEYGVGDKVQQFAPLVEGVDVVDYIKDPTWIKPFLSQGALIETDRYHRFAIRIDMEAFNLPSLQFIRDFVNRIKPARTEPLFLVRRSRQASDTVDVTDDTSFFVKLALYLSPHTLPPWDLTATEPNEVLREGSAAMFDQPSPNPVARGTSYGAIVSSFDRDGSPDTSEPSPGGPDDTIAWGFDRQYIRPETGLIATLSLDYDGVASMTLFQDIAATDQPVLAKDPLVFSTQWLASVVRSGQQIQYPQRASSAFTANYLQVYFLGTPPTGGFTYTLAVYVNGVLTLSVDLAHDSGENRYELGPSPAPSPFPVTPFALGTMDDVVVTIAPADSSPARYGLHGVTVLLGEGVSWSPGGPALSAGTYLTKRTL